jgi:L-threonylcarbamoyladenylate synthase
MPDSTRGHHRAFQGVWLPRLVRLDENQVATDLIEIDPERPAVHAIERAAAAIRRGQVVAIPTDALYTLVCDPFNLHAVGRIFEAKGRQTDRALPVLVSDVVMAEELSRETSPRFYLLARRFWPGALTIIVPASSQVPLKVTANTGRLAIRQADSKVATALLERMAQPLISTSANVSGEPTIASGIEVFGAMDGRVDLVLDGGPAAGLGATTIDITEPYWRVIKEGAIPEKEIAEILKGT